MARWDEGRRRRRMLSGRWAPDQEIKLQQHFGSVRRESMGPRSLAKNAFRKLCSELGVNYDQEPRGRHRVRGEMPEVFGPEGLLSRVGLWTMMRRFQNQLIGLREMLTRTDWSRSLGRPIARKVTPDVVVAVAHADAPGVPVEVSELRWRSTTSGGRWCWDRVSIADPAAPFYRVVVANADGTFGTDITAEILGAKYEGDDYPYRWTEGERAGQPFLPYVLYHAMRCEGLWDPYEGIEVVDGALDVGCSYTFLMHTIFQASWPQRWALGAYVAGASPVETATGPRTSVPTDPASLLHLQAEPGVQNPQVGQWGAACDVESLARTVSILERAVSDFDGLDFSHVVHETTGNPWSAEALSITGEGKRAAQERYKPELLAGDLAVIERLAAIANIETGAGFPESGYAIEYVALPLSAGEKAARRAENAELIASGRRSVIEAYQYEHPGADVDEARAALKRIAAENAEFAPKPPPVNTPANTPANQPAGA